MAGANPSMVIRVAATIAELKANLAEGKSQIETTTASLAKMAASLSGEKLIQSGHNITAAVNAIGGASKLTEAEAARVNATLTKVLEKYAALGKEAPAAMVALAEATKRVEAPSEGLSTKMVALGTAIGTMAANAAMALGRLALDGIKALAGAVGELVMSGAKLSGIDNSFQTLARTLGEVGTVMLGAMRTGTRGLVTDLDLMLSANKAVLLGLPVTAKEMGDLAQTAATLGRAMGLGPTVALDNLIVALGRSSPLILDNLGLTVKVGAANDTYAAAMGIVGRELDEAEKKTAFYNAVMVSARAKVAELGEAHLTVGENIQKAGVWWDNFKNDLSIAIARSPVLGAGMTSLGASIAAAFGTDSAGRVKTLTDLVNKFAIWVVDAGIYLVEFGRIGVQVFGMISVPQKALTASFVYLVERFAAGIAVMAELAAQLPGVGGAFDGVAASARAGATAWAAIRTEASGALTSAMAMATGQGAVHTALDKTTTALVNAKAAMVASSLATEQAKPTQEAFTKATDGQTAALAAATDASTIWGDGLPVEKTETFIDVLDRLIGVQEPIRTELKFTTETIGKLGDEAAEAGKKLEAFKARQLAGGSFQVDRGSVAQSAAYFNQQGDFVRIPEAQVMAMAHRGFSLQEIIMAFRMGLVDEWVPHGPRIPGFAGGVTNFQGGPAWVGERGPELVQLPRGSNVIPNHQMAGSGGVNLTVNLTVKGSVIGTDAEFQTGVTNAILNVFRSGGIPLPAMH